MTRSEEEELASLEEGMPSLQPFVEDFTCILHMCRNKRNSVQALHLHAYMCQNGLESHPSVGNHLFSILVEAGSMCHARQVFDRLVHQDECSWNLLIIGYVKCGELRHALAVYQKMHENDSLHPSGHAFVALVKACATLKDLERGCELHAEIAGKGLLERDVFVGSSLVHMFAKCGSLARAQEVFDRLPTRDVVVWNAIIAGYAEHGHGEKALHFFEHMQLKGVSLNAVTLVCSLTACGSIQATVKGQEIHAEIARKGLERELTIGNSLVDMYAKCGWLATAQEVFGKILLRDVVSWNALIIGYAEQGCGEEALSSFEQMQHEGISPDDVTFLGGLKACGSTGTIDQCQEIHAKIVRIGLERQPHIGNTLVDMYAKCGSLGTAEEVFEKLPVQDVVLWNALLGGYAEYGCGKEALYCFEQMQQEGVSPSLVTFVCILKACGSIEATFKGREIHVEVARKGLERELLIGSTLVDMYAKCDSLAEAWEVFDKLPVRTAVSWNALIAGYAKHGHGEKALNCLKQMQNEGISPGAVTLICSLKACGSIGAIGKHQEIHAEIARKGLEREILVGNVLVDVYAKCGLLAEAQKVFDKLLVRDVVSWSSLIAGYTEQRCGEEALYCLEDMQHEGISLNPVTFVCSLKACGTIGATVKGREMHSEIAKKGLEREPLVGNMLVDMYANCGSLVEAQEVFEKLPVQEVVLWNVLITGYAQLGESENVMHVFDRMLGEGIKPDLVTFISVLNACSHAGLVAKGQMYFEAINDDYGLIPTLKHYTCMVDLLGRAGLVDKAVAMIKKMPLQPDMAVWLIVLGACRKWGNVELGRHAFDHAVLLDEKDSAAYVCMSNIYADAAMLEEADKVEAMRVEKQAWNESGHSWRTDALEPVELLGWE